MSEVCCVFLIESVYWPWFSVVVPGNISYPSSQTGCFEVCQYLSLPPCSMCSWATTLTIQERKKFSCTKTRSHSHKCTCRHTHTCTCPHPPMHTYIHPPMHIYTFTTSHTCSGNYSHTWMGTHTDMRMSTHTHTCIHTHSCMGTHRCTGTNSNSTPCKELYKWAYYTHQYIQTP